MEVWTQGYVADVGYIHGFHRELTPSLLAFAMLLKGLRPPELGRPFAYLELGFGQGFSTNLLAAANPLGSFWGTDFNPSHAAFASRLAADAGTPNVRFLDESFEGLSALDTPSFDLVGLHGVYSWISRENRQAIVRLIRDKLGFGGLVYNSYNCLPGWSPAMPLRQLLIAHGAGSSEPTIARLDKALAFAARLAGLEAAYFAVNPGVGRRLESMREASRNYLAHEYLNRDWNPQYHAEVAAEMSDAKLTFATSAHLADHLDALNLTAEARQLLAEIGDPVFRETVRDYFVNQQFRRDIYVKGALRLSAMEQRELLAATRFALLTPRDEVPMKAAFSLGEASFQEEVYGPVLDALASGPATSPGRCWRSRGSASSRTAARWTRPRTTGPSCAPAPRPSSTTASGCCETSASPEEHGPAGHRLDIDGASERDRVDILGGPRVRRAGTAGCRWRRRRARDSSSGRRRCRRSSRSPPWPAPPRRARPRCRR
jgi:hypothetical protein